VFGYDSDVRPLTLTLTLGLDGAPGVYTLGYDANGRLQTVAYPSGFTAKYAYTSLGYLYRISDNTSGKVFWTGSARDAELHLLTQLQGSGVTTTQAFDPNTGLVQSILAGASNGVSNQTFAFDSLGRLTSRTWLNNAGASVKENSCFDGLNRLTSTLVTGGTACTGTGAVVLTYDALGNITSKSDICATAGCFAYGSGAGPHALTSITGTYNGVVNPTFAYDANGVMTSGAGRAVTATSFNMAASIVDGSNTATLAYDADHARYRMTATGQNAGTIYYLNDPSSGAMEEESIAGGVTTWHDYIMVEGRMVAERFCTGASPCASGGATLNYFVTDHLGSITVITDGSGNVLQRLSYDAWGKRRNADGSALNCTAGLASPGGVNRGFTGQEMIDGVCLINFNARIYDPSIGRFMSADPIVGDETVPQELNRYSYVLNDPLSLTDPSGMCGIFCIFKDVLDVLAIFFPELQPLDRVIDIAAQFVAIAENPEEGVLGILVGPGLAQLILTGNFKEFALNAFEAGLFYESGNLLQNAGPNGFLGVGHDASKFIAHGLVGGLVSELRSNNFASGFLAGGLSSLSPLRIGQVSLDGELIERQAEALGGIGSVLGGGKFEDGAQTGAFGYLFNDSCHAGGSGSPLCRPGSPAQNAANSKTFWNVMANVYGAVLGGPVADLIAAKNLYDFLNGAAQSPEPAVCCFVAGTLVATKTGERRIEKIKVGDLILSRDAISGKTSYKPVAELIHRHHREIYRVKFEIHSAHGSSHWARFETTNDHPWRSADGRWIRTQELTRGATIVRASGSVARVLSITRTGRTAPTFNLDVSDFHTYFVGRDQIWVHNAGCDPFSETFDTPAAAIGDVNGVAEYAGQGTTNNTTLYNAGYTKTYYFDDSNGVQHTVFYNPTTKLYGGGHPSSGY